MKTMLGPVWVPVESVSGAMNLGTADKKRLMAYDGRVVWIWTRSRIQFVSTAGLLISPLSTLAQ